MGERTWTSATVSWATNRSLIGDFSWIGWPRPTDSVSVAIGRAPLAGGAAEIDCAPPAARPIEMAEASAMPSTVFGVP